jgi:hypothetical protein
MSSGRIQVQTINALAELERVGLTFEPAGEDEVRCICPFHDDTSPSMNVNIQKNVFKCHVADCGASGDIVKLLAQVLQQSREEVVADLSKRYSLETVKTISQAVVERYHQSIWDSGHFLNELYKRGVTDELIRKARLGFFNGRITIPVKDRSGQVINIRRYLPGAPGPEKMKNTPGYGAMNIYQIEQLEYDRIWICGGEMKALVASKFLEPYGIGSISVTAGEGNWEPKWSSLFKGKRVYICFDVDSGGLVGARQVANHIYRYASKVSILHLPLDRDKFPKGDINDWVMTGAKDSDFTKLMEGADLWHPAEKDDPNECETISVRLSKASDAEFVGKRLEMEAIVTAMDTTPFLIPKDVGVMCTRDQPNCSWCPINTLDPNPDTGYVAVSVKSTSPGILDMINSPKRVQDECLKDALKIPACKVAKLHIKTHYNVTDLRLSPQLHIGNEASDNIVQPAYVVDHAPDQNSPYIFQGRLFPLPRSQQAILLLDQMKEASDNLTSFAPTAEELEELQVFQPTAWTESGLQEKLDEIYGDLEANVSHIFHRRDLHIALDLSYHSTLMFKFDKRPVNGWTNILIVGDSSQGKSETALRLMQHYGLGERVDCKNATVAGLQGGLVHMGSRWFVQWGTIPMHDRRLVILEEVKGADPEIIAALTDMRSSGIAQLTKIERRKAHARTRLVFISNPRSGRPVSAYNFGIEVIKELMGGLEDIRRLDFAIIVASSQVDPSEINRLTIDRPTVPHRYSSDLCRRLVLWAWTRKPEEVKFSEATVRTIMKKSTYLSEKFSEALPLIDRGTMRYKLARLAVAMAARTFSCDETFTTLIVRDSHVEFVADLIDRVYSDGVFGYADFSKAQIHANEVQDKPHVRRVLLSTKYPRDLVENLLYANEITINDLSDWCECDRDSAQRTLSLLIRKHALFRKKHWYLKTSDFTAFLKSMKAEGVPQFSEIQKEDKF